MAPDFAGTSIFQVGAKVVSQLVNGDSACEAQQVSCGVGWLFKGRGHVLPWSKESKCGMKVLMTED